MRKLFVSVFSLVLLLPIAALAQFSPADTGLSETGGAVYGNDTPPEVGEFIGTNIILPAFSIVGIIFLLLTVYAGFLWMTAGGKEAQVAKAKTILVSSIIGAVIVGASYAITNFIFNSISQV
jgi:hypothetical protein